MRHLDLRQSGNAVLITASPAEADGAPARWQVRLRDEDGGEGLNQLGTALAEGRAHVLLLGRSDEYETLLAFMPHQPEEGQGTLTRVRTTVIASSDVTFERARNYRLCADGSTLHAVRHGVTAAGARAWPHTRGAGLRNGALVFGGERGVQLGIGKYLGRVPSLDDELGDSSRIV